ncbi:MAG: HEAT repeat domain-containing protein [Isosphaeraceae bacterium]|nr:HEAT repeat domain-containing protein [Isosphaeraceae bacterium]
MSQSTESFDFPPSQPKTDPALVDLPPVEAPSAGFIVQLFVIPAIVVFVVILVWLLFGKLAGGERDAMSYVEMLRSPNANWRAAHELASLIQNDPKLSNDPRLLGELTDLLSHDLDREDNPELTKFVALSLGAFQTLDAELSGGRKVDPLAALARALEPKQPLPVRIAAAMSLAKQAARSEGKLEDPGAVKALGTAAHDGEPALRQVAIYALGFCGGEGAAELLRDRLNDEDRDVRYNAACALGRRGDLAAAAILRELLSSKALNQVVTSPTETEKRSKIEFLELEALQSLQSSVSHGKTELAVTLRPEVMELSQSGLVSVRNSALGILRSVPERTR